MLNRQSPAHYKKMYDRVSSLAKIGVWEFDLVTEQLAWTDAVYDIFGLRRGLPIDRVTALQFYDPASRIEMERLRSEALRTGGGFTLDIQIRPDRASARWVRLTALVETESGKAVRIYGTKQDVTREKEIYDKIQALQTNLIHVSRRSAMESLASTIAHELNQPLAAISSYLSALRRLSTSGEIDPLIEECIAGALEAVQRAGRITRSVRNLKAIGGTERLEIDIEPVLRTAVDLALASFPNLSASWNITPNLKSFGDPIQIQQVMINILRNAGEASGDAPCHIDITATSTDSFIEISVSDNGPGIPAHIVPQVCEAFVTTKPQGLGVGLSIARTIIEAHSGQFSVLNREEEGGATAHFTLPLSSLRRAEMDSAANRSDFH